MHSVLDTKAVHYSPLQPETQTTAHTAVNNKSVFLLQELHLHLLCNELMKQLDAQTVHYESMQCKLI